MQNMQLEIINHYGLKAQIRKLKEEMTELAYSTSEENFIEEIADVLNVLEQIILYKQIGEKVRTIQIQKLKRQLNRISKSTNTITEGEK